MSQQGYTICRSRYRSSNSYMYASEIYFSTSEGTFVVFIVCFSIDLKLNFS